LNDRLTPEERAVLATALELADDFPWKGTPNPTDCGLIEAVAAYREATAPPKPFERDWVFVEGVEPAPEPLEWPVSPPFEINPEDSVWRCIVTPTERVR
jgi:hypothetical protein